MYKLGYSGSETCKVSGVHALDMDTGRCRSCGGKVLVPISRVAYEAVALGPKKKAPVKKTGTLR
jgi:hypothetical protein